MLTSTESSLFFTPIWSWWTHSITTSWLCAQAVFLLREQCWNDREYTSHRTCSYSTFTSSSFNLGMCEKSLLSVNPAAILKPSSLQTMSAAWRSNPSAHTVPKVWSSWPEFSTTTSSPCLTSAEGVFVFLPFLSHNSNRYSAATLTLNWRVTQMKIMNRTSKLTFLGIILCYNRTFMIAATIDLTIIDMYLANILIENFKKIFSN